MRKRAKCIQSLELAEASQVICEPTEIRDGRWQIMALCRYLADWEPGAWVSRYRVCRGVRIGRIQRVWSILRGRFVCEELLVASVAYTLCDEANLFADG